MYRLSVDGWTLAVSKTIGGLFGNYDNEYWYRNSNTPWYTRFGWRQMRIYWRKNNKRRWKLIGENISGYPLRRKEWNVL